MTIKIRISLLSNVLSLGGHLVPCLILPVVCLSCCSNQKIEPISLMSHENQSNKGSYLILVLPSLPMHIYFVFGPTLVSFCGTHFSYTLCMTVVCGTLIWSQFTKKLHLFREVMRIATTLYFFAML